MVTEKQIAPKPIEFETATLPSGKVIQKKKGYTVATPGQVKAAGQTFWAARLAAAGYKAAKGTAVVEVK
jgi:hypothetical protein